MTKPFSGCAYEGLDDYFNGLAASYERAGMSKESAEHEAKIRRDIYNSPCTSENCTRPACVAARNDEWHEQYPLDAKEDE